MDSGLQKAWYFEQMAIQIEKEFNGSWVAAPLRGHGGEFVFAGKKFGVHALVITSQGQVYHIGYGAQISNPNFFVDPPTCDVTFQ